MFHFFPDVTIKDHTMLQGDSGGSLITTVVSGRRVEVYPVSSLFWVLFRFRLCQNDYLLICHLHQCGGSPDWISSQVDQPENKWWNCSYGSVNNWQEWKKEAWDMMTTFCCHDQAKVESLEVLTTLHQWDSPKLSVVVVRIFTNSPLPPLRILSASLTWM